MPGMLDEALAQAPPQSSGPPMEQTPPAATSPQSGAPGPGQPPPQQMVDRSGDPREGFEEKRDAAVQIIYGERFDKLIEMFQANGPEKFGRSMGIAINTALAQLEKQGPMPFEMAAQIGMDLYMKLLEDIVGENVVPGITQAQVRQALPQALQMYADSHPDVSQADIQGVAKGAIEGVEAAKAAGGEQPADAAAAPEAEGTAPPAETIPPEVA